MSPATNQGTVTFLEDRRKTDAIRKARYKIDEYVAESITAVKFGQPR